jgi:arginyl-tRNA synthetase
MIKIQLKEKLDAYFQKGVEKQLWSDNAFGKYTLEKPKHESHGDFSTNLAMVIGGREKKKPRDIAESLVEIIGSDPLFSKIEIAGPGFVNFSIDLSQWQAIINTVVAAEEKYGLSSKGNMRKVMVEFVSANPTGPLSVGHGRQAVLGDSIARLLTATGHDVSREYYYNDAGRQMRVLGESTRARYLELLKLDNDFPEDGYQGEYIYDIAREIISRHDDSQKDNADVMFFKGQAEKAIFKDIDGTLKRMGISFDHYFNEHSLYEDGHIDDVVKQLRSQDFVYDKDGAVWFKTTEFGMEKDRVIIKSTGEPTYRLPDIAYHREKFKRGFDWMVNVFGSDHIATVPDVLAGIEALGYDKEKVTVVLHQFVTLVRDGKQVKMSTRKANFVTLDELLEEVGPDVVRFFFLTRKADSQLDFDLNVACKQSQENPVYYIQYAHARLSSINRKAEEKGIEAGDLDSCQLNLLDKPEEITILKMLDSFPGVVEKSAFDLEPHKMVYFLQELAAKFHSYYNKHRIITDNSELSRARLWLASSIKIVLKNGLKLIGVTVPDVM